MTMSAITGGHALFAGINGYLGLGPANMRRDDHVCILAGSRVPLILRKESEGGRYKF